MCETHGPLCPIWGTILEPYKTNGSYFYRVGVLACLRHILTAKLLLGFGFSEGKDQFQSSHSVDVVASAKQCKRRSLLVNCRSGQHHLARQVSVADAGNQGYSRCERRSTRFRVGVSRILTSLAHKLGQYRGAPSAFVRKLKARPLPQSCPN